MRRQPHIRRYLISGVLTLIPLWVTWVVVSIVFRQLSRVGLPWVRVVAGRIDEDAPLLAQLLLQPWFQSVLAVVLTLFSIYLLGLLVSQVVGRRLVTMFESIVARVPGIQTIYGSVKKLIAALQRKPDGVQRVVLIEFPSPQMRAVGFVTRTFTDPESRIELAAVYVPTTPNPTNGFVEIVPVEKLIPTPWTMDEAMNFIVSGGTAGPDTVLFNRPAV
ncbi:MAG: DUF502 domain-containing protein [Gammaproteobacteria bacterium]|nr:DUF502 domain-containing protein [Gammaproteobacteria bacterium]NNF60530.1 DUF502 domain-containing protein [Gammaproteobacteria bacterium]NNM20288.1 DUF502 domain-containing protein [Gammaproteobacteria bacterium]